MQSFTNKDKKKNKIKFFLILGWVGFFFSFFGLKLEHLQWSIYSGGAKNFSF